MIRPHPPPQPPPPQRPPFLRRPTDIPSFDSLPTTPTASNFSDLQYSQDNRNSHDLQSPQNIHNVSPLSDGSARQPSALPFSQMPMRYAHPLPRTNSYPPQGSQKEEQRRVAAQSEHMLRRKTPNGILNAAYDGTSVEQTERPHAMKHILLPVTEHFSTSPAGTHQGKLQTITRDLPLRPTLQHLDSGFGLGQQSSVQNGVQNGVPNQLQNGMWQSNLHFAPEHAKAAWNVPHLPQIDSMLNQMPAQSPHLQYLQNRHSPFAFMPPAFQPSFGPTASNDTGPYGPYWPNGTFVPYRPAALRDMRYYPHHTSTWANQPIHNDTSNFQNSTWYPVSQHRQDLGNMTFATPQHFLTPTHEDVNAQQSISKFLSSQPVYSSVQTQQSDRSFLVEESMGFMNSTSSLRMPAVPPLEIAPRFGSGQTTPTPRNYQPASSALNEFGAGSSNAQLREKVFSWAHSIYIDLLKHLHTVRRRGQQSRHGNSYHTSGPNIYPRPPRQPSCDFSSGSSSSRSRSGLDHHGLPHSTGQQHTRSTSHKDAGLERDPLLRGLAPASWLPRGRSYDVSRENWQPQPYRSPPHPQPLHGAQQSRTLRRTSGTLNPTHHAGTRPETNHVGNATAALDSIAKICQDADWKWVDGLLLGGCLAYALGDYQKAAEWYTKILNMDSRYVKLSIQ
jgi:hypothetical protein